MATPPLKDSSAWQAVNAVAEHGSVTGAAQALGIPRSTLCTRLDVAKRRGITADSPAPPETPEFPPTDVPFEKRRDLQRESFEARQASYAAHTWLPFRYADNLPIGLCFVGDQHLDDDGHDAPGFDRDIQTLSRTEGVELVNIGDLVNSWPESGRLAGKFADQSFRTKDAVDAIRWMLDLPVTWRVILFGNHEGFSRHLEDLIREIGRDKDTLFHKWECRFVLHFPNGRRCFIRAAHDLKGHSWFHNTHGNIRALLESPTHIIVAGHRHNAGYLWQPAPQVSHLLNENLSFVAHMVRVAGYKRMDDYALVKGFPDAEDGESAIAVVDPMASTGSQFVKVFMNVEDGCAHLKWLRAKRKRELARDT